MKPDWQNKSFAKGGAATGPLTMHAKLKVGMSSLHSKIGMANSNMPQAPKPAVRKFADGGVVRTRSDDEIGDTDPRTGKVDPGSYDRRMAEGAKNMERLSSAADTLKSFFSSKEAPASASNITGDSGMSASDMAKKQAMSGGAQMPAAAEEPRRQISDYMVKKEATEAKTEPVAAPVEAEPVKVKKVVKQAVKPSAEPATPKATTPAQPKETAAQMREKQLRASGGSRGSREKEAVTDTGDETKRLFNRTSKFVPGFGRVSNTGMIGGGKTMGQSIEDAGVKIDKAMTDAGTRYLQSKMDRGETLTTMEKAQAKRAGII
jgi:hypothetical protein